MRVLSFSTKYPSYHPRKGEPTYFVGKIWLGLHQLGIDFMDSDGWKNDMVGQEYNDIKWIAKNLPKYHTIRSGHRWKAGDWFQPVIWGDDINPKSGRSGPYHSKQIKFVPPIEIKKVWDFKIVSSVFYVKNKMHSRMRFAENPYCTLIAEIAKNDGLSIRDFLAWFQYPKSFDGQIICWNDKIEY